MRIRWFDWLLTGLLVLGLFTGAFFGGYLIEHASAQESTDPDRWHGEGARSMIPAGHHDLSHMESGDPLGNPRKEWRREHPKGCQGSVMIDGVRYCDHGNGDWYSPNNNHWLVEGHLGIPSDIDVELPRPRNPEDYPTWGTGWFWTGWSNIDGFWHWKFLSMHEGIELFLPCYPDVTPTTRPFNNCVVQADPVVRANQPGRGDFGGSPDDYWILPMTMGNPNLQPIPDVFGSLFSWALPGLICTPFTNVAKIHEHGCAEVTQSGPVITVTCPAGADVCYIWIEMQNGDVYQSASMFCLNQELAWTVPGPPFKQFCWWGP